MDAVRPRILLIVKKHSQILEFPHTVRHIEGIVEQVSLPCKDDTRIGSRGQSMPEPLFVCLRQRIICKRGVGIIHALVTLRDRQGIVVV